MPPPAPVGLRGMVLGVAFLIVLLVGFAVWADRLGRGPASEPAVPQMILHEPRDGSVVEGPVRLDFEVPADLRWGRDGWQAGGFHVHAAVDGAEVMPRREDITRLEAGRYRWDLGRLGAGERELRLFWSDSRHRPIEAGSSRTVRIEAR